jgi:hypothetical protein
MEHICSPDIFKLAEGAGFDVDEKFKEEVRK